MVSRAKVREIVLYYTPDKKAYEAKLKGILVRMGVRIKVVAPDQVMQTVGVLAGISEPGSTGTGGGAELPVILDEVLVMHQFSTRRMDEFFHNMRKAGIPRIALKAVLTETNREWTFYHLYEEILAEHKRVNGQEERV